MIQSIRLYNKQLLKRLDYGDFVLKFSTSSQTQLNTNTENFRTTEANPINHNVGHLGQYYRILGNDNKIFLYGGLPKSFAIQTKTFNETCLMIRKSSTELINCLKTIDYSKPAVRFVIYGKKGSGKSLSLAHILHYGYKSGFVLVHVPWVGNWMRSCKESSNSESKEGFINLNLDAAAWLLHFKSQNQHLLSDPRMKTSEDYVWSKRETTVKGSPLSDLIDHGINRIKYASDCVVNLAKELKILSCNGDCKTLVVIDGFNAFFYPKPRIFTEKKELVHPHKVTLTEAFLNLTKFDWTNAAIVVTVDELAIAEEDHKSHLPRYLLGKDGFEHLDPFVPVFIDNYTDKEIKSCMDYYRERKWVQPVPGQDEEIGILSASNPYKIMQLCAAI